MAPTLHFMCGKMAAGKSTLARKLAEQHDAILICDATLRVVAVNGRACAHFGYTEDEFLGLTAYDIDAGDYAYDTVLIEPLRAGLTQLLRIYPGEPEALPPTSFAPAERASVTAAIKGMLERARATTCQSHASLSP